ncbi:hypothetical protein BX667DRAFT_518777 [Coemansia mojavensis]|nr:hypothetical protein BX667DRAFT_518777 [Coemansia mojavensis]
MLAPFLEGMYPKPRGRPPLGDKQRNRLTIKFPNANNGAETKPEVDESETQLEEQFIIRVLPEMAESFGKLVSERQIQDKLEIKFRDERNAIIDQVPLARGLDIIYPDGFAPPLANVRKNRFRPRIPRSKIDSIEREVLRLLEEDAQAMSVKFDLYDEQGEEGRGGTPSIDIMSPVTLDDLATPMVADEDATSSIANEDLEFDESLAAELEQGLEELRDDDDDDDDDDDEESEEEEEEDQPNNERSMQMKLLGEEIAELEQTIAKKNADLDSAPNPLFANALKVSFSVFSRNWKPRNNSWTTIAKKSTSMGLTI